jgi:hypothetical protein
MRRDEILKEAENLINGTRSKEYGNAYQNHKKIARMWSEILGQDVSVQQVYMCMIAVKLSRLTKTPDHHDSWVDIIGYAALAGES